MDEKATHKNLIMLKDEMDQAKLQSKIEIIRNTG